MHRRPKYSAEFRERAVRLCLHSERRIKDVALDLGVNTGTLGNWVADAREAQQAGRAHAAVGGDGLDVKTLRAAERARLRELERENAELRRANEILKAATAFFAQEADQTRPQR